MPRTTVSYRIVCNKVEDFEVFKTKEDAEKRAITWDKWSDCGPHTVIEVKR